MKKRFIFILTIVSLIFPISSNAQGLAGLNYMLQYTGLSNEFTPTPGYEFMPPNGHYGQYGASASLLRTVNRINYPTHKSGPSYQGWYGPYGHIGFPCKSCHRAPHPGYYTPKM